MKDKDYCMSSFLTFRYIVDDNKSSSNKLPHRIFNYIPENEKFICFTAEDINQYLQKQLLDIDPQHTGLLLSGGIDSAILASFMPKGMKAYTARCIAPNAVDETKQAKRYCEINGLIHKIVDVTWDDYDKYMDQLMLYDGCPVFANEPQVYKLVREMKKDGITKIIYGDSADMVFGGYDRLLSRDWTYEEWKNRFSFVKLDKVLHQWTNMDLVYERYKKPNGNIDYLYFMDIVFNASSSGAYINAFDYGKMDYLDPYARLKMGDKLDLSRVRNGESKYLLRELFKMKYPDLDIPEKIAMARAVDYWLKEWKGPERYEFKPECTREMSGEQKFLVYSLERFLNIADID